MALFKILRRFQILVAIIREPNRHNITIIHLNRHSSSERMECSSNQRRLLLISIPSELGSATLLQRRCHFFHQRPLGATVCGNPLLRKCSLLVTGIRQKNHGEIVGFSNLIQTRSSLGVEYMHSILVAEPDGKSSQSNERTKARRRQTPTFHCLFYFGCFF